MQQFRRSLTAREGSGVPLFLDRVLLGWLLAIEYSLPTLTKEDFLALADLCARAVHKGRPLFRNFERPDRVFLNRAFEHVLAKRLLGSNAGLPSLPSEQAAATRELLAQISREDWVRFRYGDPQLSAAQGRDPDDGSQRSEVVARTSLAAIYDLQSEPDQGFSQTVLQALETAPVGNRPRIIDTLRSGPNLFLPLGNALRLIDQRGQERIQRMRDVIFGVTRQGSGWNWPQRAQVLDAVVRAFLREDILLRLPRDVFRGEDETWAESLLRGLHQVGAGGAQLEPVAGRVEEFLRELSEMGGEEREAHLRYAMNARAESVVLVTGSSKVDRDAIFSGFNTPLLPDILVCTQVGQEGIDLHRHCRHVVHYDLGWNPAAIEQRTGRTDRIGSKAARERKMALEASGKSHLPEDQLPGLDIAIPYLAGTYDERMFEKLRTRAQVFDILTGGDPTADQESGSFWLDPDSEGEDDSATFVPLPRQMLDDLRVDLAISVDSSSIKEHLRRA
jgi:Helicase conserved C-terminal domain